MSLLYQANRTVVPELCRDNPATHPASPIRARQIVSANGWNSGAKARQILASVPHADLAVCGHGCLSTAREPCPPPFQKPSRSIRFRSSLRARRTASAASRARRSEGFS
jgi:hypothetical protein